jgi:predicted aspartyl protease
MAVDAIIDTGFTQYLTLPAQLIGQLGLTRQGTVTIVLADGSNKRVPVFNAKVGLGGTFRSVDIEESEGDIILVMGLLYNCRLSIEAIEDGHVFIEVID